MPFAGNLPDNNFAAYKAEMVRWKCKWQNVTEKPSTLIDTLKHAKPELYPNIHRAVKVLLTMPVTSANTERSVSALKRIKTYLRSTMVEDRLNGLSLMHVRPACVWLILGFLNMTSNQVLSYVMWSVAYIFSRDTMTLID